MDVLDVLVVIAALIAAYRGWRLGAIVQFGAILGLLAGLAIGAILVQLICPHLSGELEKTAIAIALLIFCAVLFSRVARQGATVLSRAVHFKAVTGVNSALGALFASASTLLVSWIFASMLLNSSLPSVSEQIESSRVITAISKAMPPFPNAFAPVERYLAANGFPQALANALPEPIVAVRPPGTAQVRATLNSFANATVEVIAQGCGDVVQEGSGFFATSNLVVTNAHVIAGTNAIVVKTTSNNEVHATPVLFDPKFDIAILRTVPVGRQTLAINPSYVERGQTAVVLAHPGGGPLQAIGAGVLDRFTAIGRDIYDTSLTTRVVYGLEAPVRAGDSGGPLIDSQGSVIGVVFSRSAANPDLGYALSSPGVRMRVLEASRLFDPVSTQGCIS